ncbi:uncharacterized protein LOC142335455 [Convolutriloba macropyga]|uniref:uncharacterized protein LOC142335455 n=1 Tax=Convolutriloba macropyga TaxID=536237 RepID=UPI003F524573
MVKKKKKSFRKKSLKKSPINASIPVGTPRSRAWEPTELARVKHYVLHGVSELHEWPETFGVYICGEQYPECRLPFHERQQMQDSAYVECNYTFSSSLFHLNCHSKCTLPRPVMCNVTNCGIEFHKADILLQHLQFNHLRTYQDLWTESTFALKPNAQQFMFGMYTIMTNNKSVSKLRWVCIYCTQKFSSPEEWHNHRRHSNVCRAQVVEIVWNSRSEKWANKWRLLNSSFKKFVCGVCEGNSAPTVDGRRKSKATSSDVPKEKEEAVEDKNNFNDVDVKAGNGIDDDVYGSRDPSDDARTVVMTCGSLSDFLSHICERHTHKAFVCLSCVKVIHVADEEHHRSCLGVSCEGLVDSDRIYPNSKQIVQWVAQVTKELVAAGDMEYTGSLSTGASTKSHSFRTNNALSVWDLSNA